MSKIQNNFTIPYKIHEIEGQCTLKQIKCLKFVKWKFILYCVVSFLTLGIPILICYWYPRLIKQLYYEFVPLKISTHFYIINYDDAVTIVLKEFGTIYLSKQESIETIFFTNRYLKYYYNHEEQCFIAVTYDFFFHIKNLINTYKISGYSEQQAQQLKNCYGFGTMILPTPSCLILFVRQILQPFFLFIIISTIIWFYGDYIQYGVIVLITSTISICINLIQIMEINKKIFEMAYYNVKIYSLRNGNVVEISSVDVVPGDIVFINNSLKLPFDGILLGGSVLMNQCVLTGESVPIVKKAINKQQFNSNGTFDKSCLVFEGTQVVQICSKSSNAAHIPFFKYGLMVCVTKTNFTTLKGQLIRTISFPKAKQMKFYIEAAKFIGFLIIVAIISYLFLMIKLVKIVQAGQLIINFCYLIIITVPPGLPASMSLGIAYSIKRLKQLQIYCISPDKIIIGGKINHVCFDKTGTLTQLYMDFHQFCPSLFGQFLMPLNLNNRDSTASISRQVFYHTNYQHSLVNMATCHSIVNLQQTGQLVGDPMEIKLFKFGKFQLINFCQLTSNFSSKLFSFRNQYIQGSVFRRFQFNPEVNRMSVIALSSINKNNAFVYCKGSPDQLLKVMRKDSIPPNYLQQLKRYTSSGLRVLAICSKKISISQIEIIDRQTAESQLVFNGFEVFQNKLKMQTIPAIKQLKQANIGMVIITGDNSFIGANIAFKSRIISHSLTVLICQLTEQNQIQVFNFEQVQETKQKSQNIHQSICLVQEDSGYDLSQRSEKVIKSIQYTCSIQDFPDVSMQYIHKQQCVLCITGQIFQKVYNQQQNGNVTDVKKQLLKYIKVFARSKPNDKTKIVSMFQQIGKITAMCGDGANDCGALKQADIGLSLSDSQASISSPFTSNVQNISSIVNLIRQCRGGLATNFSLFNIMALYSLIQFTSTVITTYFYSFPSHYQFLYWDLICNFFFFLTIGYTATQQKLSKLVPSDSLFSVSNLSCVLIMFAFQFICQIMSILIMSNQPFSSFINYWQIGGQTNNLIIYKQSGVYLRGTPEPTTIFMVSNFMYLFSVIGFSISSPWKKSVFTNKIFMPIYLVIFLYSVLICIVPQARFFNFDMLDFEIKLNSMILGIGIMFGLIMCFNQKYILQPLFRRLQQRYPDKKWL